MYMMLQNISPAETFHQRLTVTSRHENVLLVAVTSALTLRVATPGRAAEADANSVFSLLALASLSARRRRYCWWPMRMRLTRMKRPITAATVHLQQGGSEDGQPARGIRGGVRASRVDAPEVERVVLLVGSRKEEDQVSAPIRSLSREAGPASGKKRDGMGDRTCEGPLPPLRPCRPPSGQASARPRQTGQQQQQMLGWP